MRAPASTCPPILREPPAGEDLQSIALAGRTPSRHGLARRYAGKRGRVVRRADSSQHVRALKLMQAMNVSALPAVASLRHRNNLAKTRRSFLSLLKTLPYSPGLLP